MLDSKKRLLVVPFLVLAILVGALLIHGISVTDDNKEASCYIGVAFGGDTDSQAQLLIDRIKGYSNLFILQSGPVSTNETATTEICDYAVASGMSIIVYFGDLDPNILSQKNLTWRSTWVNNAKSRYGDHFLGVYYYDERGGIYLDSDKNATNWHLPPNSTYDSVASMFENGFLQDRGTVALNAEGIPIFCSDYALYWFDYLSGYDTVLAQIGWNQSMVKDIALVRGAANLQHKTWGAIITWKNTVAPYLDTGDAVYEQMLSAYEAGAKYIAIFNYPYSNDTSYGIMFDEHFEALQRLWNDVSQKTVVQDKGAEAVLVLPRNYGYGLRSPDDKIWGFWGPDDKTAIVWTVSQTLLDRYGYALDIVYDDKAYGVANKYQSIFYWNSTII